MKAVVFRGKGNLVLEDYPLPLLKQGWVRIRVEEAGICGSDLHVLKLGYQHSSGDMEGQILGHENAGVVVEAGKKVNKIKEGERVAIRPWITCGKCSYCRSGFFVHCPEAGIIGYEYPGGFAQFIDVPETIVFKISDSVSFSEATQIDGVSCAVHALAVGNFKPGETEVVIGDGAIGLFSIQAALLSNPKNLIVVGKHEKNLKIASELGATATININEANPIEAVKEITKGKGADVVIETVGRESDTVEDAIQMAAPAGRIVLMGVFTEPRTISLRSMLFKEIKIVGSLAYGYWGDKSEFQMALDLMEDKKIKVEPLITHKLELERIKEALHIFTNKNETGAIKVILLPQK